MNLTSLVQPLSLMAQDRISNNYYHCTLYLLDTEIVSH